MPNKTRTDRDHKTFRRQTKKSLSKQTAKTVTDGSQHKRAEVALQESAAQFHAVFEHAPIGIAQVTLDGHFENTNPALQQMLGYNAEELERMDVDSFSPKEDIEQEIPLIQELIAGNRPSYQIEKRYRRKNGEELWGQLTASLVRDDRGEIKFGIGTLEDVTKRKQNEQALQQRNDELAFLNRASHALNSTLDINQVLTTMLEQASHLLNASAGSVWMTDPGGVIACQQATGAHAAAVLGSRLASGEGVVGWVAQNGTSTIIADTRQDSRYAKAFSEKYGVDFRSILCVPLASKQGIIGVLEIVDETANRFKSSDRLLVETFASAATAAIENARLYEQGQKELQERRRIEQALRESEMRYRLLADNSSDVIWTYDMDLRPTYVSPAVTHLRGFSVTEVLNQNLDDVLTPASAERARDLFATVLADAANHLPENIRSESRTLELEMKRKDGTTVWTETRMSFILNAQGKPIGIQGSSRDISERKRIEAEYMAQRRTRELATLYEMTHDLGTFLHMPTLLETILQRASSLLAVSTGAIYLYNAERNEFNLGAQKGMLRHLGVPILPDDWHSVHPLRVHTEDPSVVRVPLTYGDELLGMLILDKLPADASGSDEASLHLIALLANHAASAIHNVQMFEHVRTSRGRAQALAHQLLSAQETERRSIARELHDEIGQALTSVQFGLQGIEPLVNQSDAQDTLEETMQVVERALQQVRDLSRTLRPAMLDDFGLVPALKWYIEQQAKRVGFQTEIIADSFEPRLPEEVETVCFRVTQEAITNSVRHARANHVALELYKRGKALELIIRDNGIGFDVSRAMESITRGHSLGLLNMKERAALIGGEVQIISVPGQGTQIHAQIPINPNDTFIERRTHKRGSN